MSSFNGYIKLHRCIQDSDCWNAEPFTRAQAWIDIILNASHSKHSVRIRGIRIDLDRGQLAISELEYAKRWKWSRGKVRRFLSELSSKTVHRIVQQKSNVTSVVSVLNYEHYQGDGTADDTPSSTTDGHQTVQQTDTYKKGKKDKKGKKGNNNTSKTLETSVSNSNNKQPHSIESFVCEPALPDWMRGENFLVAWGGWETYKKERKQKLPPSTITHQLNKLAKHDEQTAISMIEQSITNVWTGLFELTEKKGQTKPTDPRNHGIIRTREEANALGLAVLKETNPQSCSSGLPLKTDVGDVQCFKMSDGSYVPVPKERTE